jgi:hypothetical protein
MERICAGNRCINRISAAVLPLSWEERAWAYPGYFENAVMPWWGFPVRVDSIP